MSGNRVRQVMEWLYNTVFQDEDIHPRPQRREPLPSALKAARSLETGPLNSRQSHDAIFARQAVLLANYEDEYVYEQPVLRYYPTYRSLTDPELRGYFSWRTKLRRGDIQKTSLSYAFLYIYELLNQAGVENPLDGYRKLEEFRAAYGELDSRILPYLDRWLIDYVVYYDLDPALAASTPQVVFDNHLAVLADLDQYDSRRIMDAVIALSGRWLTRSKFYKQQQEDMDTVIIRVLRRISEHCDRRCKKSMTEQYFGVLEQAPVTLFESAVFHRRGKQADREYTLDPVRAYICKDGFWTVRQYACPARPSEKLAALVKAVDSIMREQYAYRYPVKRELETKWIVKIIEEETGRLLSERQEAEARKITIDFSRLEKIRRDAAVTQERLLVEEEALVEPEPAPETAAPEPGETPLSPEEYRLLQCLLYGRDYGWARDSGLMPSVLADSINEKLMDEFADSVLLVDSQPEVVEDYIQDLKEMIQP